MKILALEFSSPVRSVAVLGGVKRGYAEENGGRETKAFALIDLALKEAGLAREQIECVAVGLGPGSYAGIRIAIAIAQGWQLARQVKLLGISSADAVAAHAGQLGSVRFVSVGLEARPSELHVARYDATVFTQPKLVESFHVLRDMDRADQERCGNIFRMDWLSGVKRPEGIAFPPGAEFLGMLAESRNEFLAGHELAPIYLRDIQFVKSPPPRFGSP